MRYKLQKFAQFPYECAQTLHDGDDIGDSLRVQAVLSGPLTFISDKPDLPDVPYGHR
jgi:hypothetical protein